MEDAENLKEPHSLTHTEEASEVSNTYTYNIYMTNRFKVMFSLIFLLTRHQFSLIRFIHLPFMLSLLTTLLDQTAGGYYSPRRLFTYHLGNITLTLYQWEAAG